MARLALAKARKQRRGSGTSQVVVALAGFAVICGLLLLVLGAPGLSCGLQQDRRVQVGQRMLSALKAVQQADRALESKNYGDARDYVRQVQTEVTEALTALQGKEPSWRPGGTAESEGQN